VSEKTNIAWATMTASPWFGCSKVSAGCTHCYAEELTLRNKWAGWGDNSPRVRSKGFWKDAYRYNERAGVSQTEAQGVGLNPDNYRPRMFTSLMDWLDPKAPIEWLADFLKVIHDCQNLDWLLLTKRPELYFDRTRAALRYAGWPREEAEEAMYCPQNVWTGVTVESQQMADKRIPELLKIPARLRWLSVEPLLERVNLHQFLCGIYDPQYPKDEVGADCKPVTDPRWVVVGGESGRNRRDVPVEAIVHVANQCQLMGVPCFVKQDTHLKPGQQGRIPNDVWSLKQYPKP
jgi:protein gp37